MGLECLWVKQRWEGKTDNNEREQGKKSEEMMVSWFKQPWLILETGGPWRIMKEEAKEDEVRLEVWDFWVVAKEALLDCVTPMHA